jgi:hypothetical protein
MKPTNRQIIELISRAVERDGQDIGLVPGKTVRECITKSHLGDKWLLWYNSKTHLGDFCTTHIVDIPAKEYQK